MATFTVSGIQVQIWPFAPNWSNSVDVIQEYRTDIFKSRSGREQRRWLRRTARKSISYTVDLNGDESRTFRRLMTTWQSRPMVMADPTRKVFCPDGMPALGTVIRVEEFPSWLVVGASVILQAGAQRDIAAIQSIDTNTGYVTLDSQSDLTWPHDTEMRPALEGLVASEIATTHPNGLVTQFQINFEVTPGSEPLDDGDFNVERLNGREVLTFKPNWGESVENTHTWAPDRIDFGFGRIATYNPVKFGTDTRRSVFVSKTESEIAEMERFFRRQRGQCGEFMVPSWLNDLPMKQGVMAGTSTFVVEGTATCDAYADDPVYRSIAVMLDDGRRIYRTITGMKVSGTDTVITVNQPWMTDIPLDLVMMVCWMPVSRFATDQMTSEWMTDTVVQTTLATQSTESLPADSPLPDLSGDEQWTLENWGLDPSIAIFDRLDYAINGVYAATFFNPIAYAWTHGEVLDSFDHLVNVLAPEALT